MSPATLTIDAIANPDPIERVKALAAIAGSGYVGAKVFSAVGAGAIGVALNYASVQKVSAAENHILRERIAEYSLAPLFLTIGAQYGVMPELLAGIAAKESSMRPSAIGPAPYHAVGLMQVLPSESKRFGPLGDIRTNIRAGASILREKYEARKTTAGALAAYGGFVTKDPSDYIREVLGYTFTFIIGGF